MEIRDEKGTQMYFYTFKVDLWPVVWCLSFKLKNQIDLKL